MARSNTVVMTTKATMNGLKNLDCGITDLGLKNRNQRKERHSVHVEMHILTVHGCLSESLCLSMDMIVEE